MLPPKRVFSPHMITEGEMKVVVGSLIELWLLLLKSMKLSWSCSFSFSGCFRDVFVRALQPWMHCDHAFSWSSVLLKCDLSRSTMLQRRNFLFKNKLRGYFILQTDETNYLLNYRQSNAVPIVQPSVVCLLAHYTQSKLTVCNQLSNAIYSQEAIKLTAKVWGFSFCSFPFSFLAAESLNWLF